MPDRYFLLGGNVSNSPSPRMMNAAFEATGLDAVYDAWKVAPADLGAVLAELSRSGASGANVTIPHKTAIVSLLDSLDAVSSKIGAVNTLKMGGGGFVGYDTDVEGILEPLRSRGISEVRRASVIGTGGAARAFCVAARALGCEKLAVVSRDPERAAGFLSSMRLVFPEMSIEIVPFGGLPLWRSDLVFNASPAGGIGVPLPAQAARLVQGASVVFDAVYAPVETGLIRLAKGHGCQVVYGHEMLLHQGSKSFEIWAGRTPPLHAMGDALLDFLGVSAE